METLDELKEYLTSGDYQSVVLENPDYVTAVIGVTASGAVVYDYDKMIQFLVDKDNMDYEEAVDFVNYNTLRAIPYMNLEGAAQPIVVYSF